jgi:hypothetical protein
MDETLIYAMNSHNPEFQFWLSGRISEKMNPEVLIELPNYSIAFAKRPYCDEILEYLEGEYNVVIFTAAE